MDKNKAWILKQHANRCLAQLDDLIPTLPNHGRTIPIHIVDPINKLSLANDIYESFLTTVRCLGCADIFYDIREKTKPLALYTDRTDAIFVPVIHGLKAQIDGLERVFQSLPEAVINSNSIINNINNFHAPVENTGIIFTGDSGDISQKNSIEKLPNTQKEPDIIGKLVHLVLSSKWFSNLPVFKKITYIILFFGVLLLILIYPGPTIISFGIETLLHYLEQSIN